MALSVRPILGSDVRFSCHHSRHTLMDKVNSLEGSNHDLGKGNNFFVKYWSPPRNLRRSTLTRPVNVTIIKRVFDLIADRRCPELLNSIRTIS